MHHPFLEDNLSSWSLGRCLDLCLPDNFKEVHTVDYTSDFLIQEVKKCIFIDA